MSSNEMQQLAHLMRRAGFGATQQELEGYAAIGYEASVEKLLDTANPTAISEYPEKSKYNCKAKADISAQASGNVREL